MSNVAILLTEAELEALIDRRIALAVTTQHEKEILNLTEVCVLLGVTRKTVSRYMREGMPHTPVSPGSRVNRFHRSQVLAWWLARGSKA